MYYWRWFNRPRHPLSRLLFGVIGLVLLLGVLTLGLFALLAFAAVGIIVAVSRALSRGSAAPAASTTRHPQVIEGEFVVLPSRTAAAKQ